MRTLSHSIVPLALTLFACGGAPIAPPATGTQPAPSASSPPPPTRTARFLEDQLKARP